MEGAGACSRNLFHGVCTLCLVLAFLSLPSQGQIQEVTLKDGFSISYYSLSVPGARSISLSRGNHGGKSIVYVSTRGSNVYAVIDDNGDNQPDRTLTVINNRNIPNGIAWRNGSLFVAEVTSVWRYDNVDTHALAGSMFPAPTLVKGDLPGEFEHGWRYIAFGPDGKLYITIGAPCNICDRDGFGTITRMNPDGSGYEMFSKGIRNSVGMDWHPETNELWATDNNRDWMGDNQPDCRLLHAPTKGIDFGFPYCHCNGTGPPELRNPTPGYPIADDVFNAGERQRNCSKYPVCVGAIGPHVAPLGMRFYTGNLFPSAKYNRRTIFVAEHGSWNRPQRIGYRVSAMQLNEQGQVISHEIFANFLQPNYVGWGRPVDVEVLPDGSLVVSDDQRGVLYRITYERPFNELSLSYARRGFGGVPAKPAIAVGSDYMIAITRTEFNRALYQVFTKEPWLPVKQSFLTQFHRSGTACRVGPFPGSGFTAYDSIADRWLIMEVAREATSGTYYLCLLLSLSGVPYGLLYRGYSFALAGDPGDVVLGIMPDAYYFTTGENPPAVYALNRATLLGGRLPTAERRAATTLSGFQRQGLVPAHVHGTPRSGTSCGYFARHIDDELHGASPFPVNPTNDYIEVWYFCPSFATGGPLWGSVSLAVADFNSLLCSGNSDVPCFAQPGSTVQLVPYHEGVHPHLTYRSFASYDVLLLAFTVNVGNNQGGIKWVELRRTNTASHLAWFVYQEGVHSPDTKNRWLGSIAMDSAGNIALGYAAVNANGGVLPGLYFTGRTATAPLGTMTKNETQLVVSGKAAASSLYGGRTMVALDARDGCSFYFDGPWENGTLRSPTYLGVFRFPNCGVCSVDADCDDGLHCTDDKCRDGVCVAEPDPLLCRFGEYCDETLDACVACLDNSHCSNGAFCDGQERCVAGVCQPAATPACGAGQTCLEDQDLCVPSRRRLLMNNGQVSEEDKSDSAFTSSTMAPTSDVDNLAAGLLGSSHRRLKGLLGTDSPAGPLPKDAITSVSERPFNELSLSYNMRGNGGTAVMPAVSVGTGYMIAITRTGFSRALYQVFTKEPWLPVKQSFLTQFHRSGTACRVGPFPGSGFTAYDSMADRWLIMEVAREATSGTYYLCLLLSLSGVPYGLLYRGYSIALSGNPGDTMVLGVMPDAYYFTTGENPPAVYALNRATLLGGRLPTPERREAPALAGFQRQGLVPAHLHGNARADAACGYFARHIDDEMHVPATADPLQDFIEVWYFCPSFAIGGPQWDSIRLAVADFNSLVCSGSSNVPCFAQPGSTVQLVPFHELVNPHLSYRSFAGHDAMLLAFTVNVGNHQGGIKWVELRRTNTASHLAWFVYQEGVHSPDTKNRWLGSIAMDSAGNIALGYAGVDANNAMLPGLYFTGREVNAPLGTMTKNETQLVVSGKAAASSLYGGRTMVALDARDGCSFYFDGPWENGTLRSPTYLGVFRFPNCGVCSVDTDCDDGLHCTDDKCRDGVCVAEPDPLLCRFGEYCDETLDACVACLDNSHCSNGAFCDGQERCVAGVCQPAATPACSAGQTCLEDQDRCVDCVSDGNCTDNLFCDGAETCVNEVCQAGTPPTCPADQYCSEEVRGCAVCLVDAHCDDSTFCNGVEWCGDGTCWPYPEAETWCGEYVCDEAMDRCVECLTADTCDNGLFCDGVEVCLEDGTCAPGEPPCSDQEVCLEDQQACGDSGGIRTPLWTFVNTSSGAFAVYPSLAMGLDHLVQVVMTNQAAPASSHSAVYTVFDKATGGKLREEQLRLHHSGNCSTSPTGKGYVIYDHLADRWVMAELAVGGTRLCMLLSGDYIPTGSWTAYSFALGSITDSFTLALMPDGYFIGTMEVIPRVYALDRAAMLANAATVTMRTVAVPALPGYALLPQGMDPVTLVGPARVGRPGPCGLFLRVRDDEIHAWLLGEEPNPANDYLEIWRMCPAFANADLASLTLAADVAIAEVDTVVCGNLQQCFWQKGTLAPFLFPYAQGTLHPVAMYRALDSHESLLASLTVDASPPLPEPDPLASQQGGIHWMELRLRATSSMGWYTHQEGLLAPDTKNRFLGALAMDGSGNMLLGYSVTDASTFPSFYYSGRKQKDPLGTMPLGEYPVAVGDAPSPSPSFGARGSVTVDPSGGCMLAMVGSHGDVAGGFASSTSIALLKYSTCVDAGSLQRCGTDDECSDGNYCSGVETCSGPNESCRPGEDPCYVFGESCVAADIPCESFECTMDVDCDNGAYCDGMERCVGERCYPAVVGPCPPTTDCIEASRSCFPHMQAGVRVATNAWATVTLVRSYVSPVVVASLRNAGTNAGAVLLRVRNVTSNSFQVRVQALNGGNLNDELFDFIVMEEGSYAPSQSGGLRIEARKYVTTRVDGSAAVLGFVGEQQTLTGRFSSPVVVGQVMSANDDWSVFYSYIPAPGSSVITTGRHIGARACTSAPACHVPETVGFIVFDATLTSTITGYGASLEAFITGQTVGGASDGPPFNFPFRTPFTNALPGMAIVSVTLHPSDNVVNPGWARMFGLTMSQTEMRLFLDDDQSRSRLTTGLGRISYVAFQY
eukprot:jgi/Mesvir1/14480/Mv05187-RA.1